MQNQFLEQLRQTHMAQQREAAARQQAASADALRQQELQQRVLASLSPQQLQQLRSMPRVRTMRLASANTIYHCVPGEEEPAQRQDALYGNTCLASTCFSVLHASLACLV